MEKHVFSVYKTPSQVINVMLCYVISTLPTNDIQLLSGFLGASVVRYHKLGGYN